MYIPLYIKREQRHDSAIHSMVRASSRGNDGMSMTRNDTRRNDARSIHQWLGQKCQFLSSFHSFLWQIVRGLLTPVPRAIRPCRVPLPLDKLSPIWKIVFSSDIPPTSRRVINSTVKGSYICIWKQIQLFVSENRKIFVSISIVISVWKVELFCKQYLKGRLDFLSSFTIKIGTNEPIAHFVPPTFSLINAKSAVDTIRCHSCHV